MVQTERASRTLTRAVNEETGVRAANVEANRRNSGSIVAMGMGQTLADRWLKMNERYVNTIGRSADVVNSYGSVTKVLRLLMQSAILGHRRLSGAEERDDAGRDDRGLDHDGAGARAGRDRDRQLAYPDRCARQRASPVLHLEQDAD